MVGGDEAVFRQDIKAGDVQAHGLCHRVAFPHDIQHSHAHRPVMKGLPQIQSGDAAHRVDAGVEDHLGEEPCHDVVIHSGGKHGAHHLRQFLQTGRGVSLRHADAEFVPGGDFHEVGFQQRGAVADHDAHGAVFSHHLAEEIQHDAVLQGYHQGILPQMGEHGPGHRRHLLVFRGDEAHVIGPFQGIDGRIRAQGDLLVSEGAGEPESRIPVQSRLFLSVGHHVQGIARLGDHDRHRSSDASRTDQHCPQHIDPSRSPASTAGRSMQIVT